MAMRMLAAGGMAILEDGVRRADDDNPAGYFEDERVKNLGSGRDAAWLREARGKAVKVVSPLLVHLPAAHRYRVVLMQRDLDEVLASQSKMLSRRGETPGTNDAEMRRLFASHVEQIHAELARRTGFEVCVVHYHEVIREPRLHAERIAQFVGRRLDVHAMAGAVDPALFRNRR
jgi:hypothetical protein